MIMPLFKINNLYKHIIVYLYYKILHFVSQAYNGYPWISTNWLQPITGQESQAHFPSMQGKIRQVIQACNMQTSLSQNA